MATSLDYIEFVMDSLSGISAEFRYKKMFGEYCVYANDKPILLVCDNMVYVKMLPCIDPIMTGVSIQSPYQGAKPHYILDIENRTLTHQIIPLLEQETPLPQPKKKNKPSFQLLIDKI